MLKLLVLICCHFLGVFVAASDTEGQGNLCGYTWVDATDDGYRNTSDPPLGGVTVQLYRNGTSQLINETVSNGTGVYCFGKIILDCFTMKFVAPLGYAFSTKASYNASGRGMGSDEDDFIGWDDYSGFKWQGDAGKKEAKMEAKMKTMDTKMKPQDWQYWYDNVDADANSAGVVPYTFCGNQFFDDSVNNGPDAAFIQLDPCVALFAFAPTNNYNWFNDLSDAQKQELATYMLSVNTQDCPSQQNTGQYIIVSQTPSFEITFNGQKFEISSFGGAALCIFVPLDPTSSQLVAWGFAAVPVGASGRTFLFFFSIERMSSTGADANDDEMTMTVTVSKKCVYILIFSDGDTIGKTLVSEKGSFDNSNSQKCKLVLPHTSTVAGYSDTTDTGSSSGLYGLFALIVLPVLAFLGLIGYCIYSWTHQPVATEVFEAPAPQQYQVAMPSPYAQPVAYAPQAYYPAAMPGGYLAPL